MDKERKIPEYTFYDNDEHTSVNIPDSVTAIEMNVLLAVDTERYYRVTDPGECIISCGKIFPAFIQSF